MATQTISSAGPKIRTKLPGPKAQKVLEGDARYISPSYTRSYPLVAKRGHGVVIEDVDGNEFLDFSSGIAVVYSQSDLNESVVNAIKDQSRKDGLGAPAVSSYRSRGLDVVDTVKQIKQTGSETLFFLGSSEELMSLMREADRVKWYPSILQPGSGGGAEIFNAPAGFNGKLRQELAPATQISQ